MTPREMSAAVLAGKGDLRVERIPVPTLGPHDLLVCVDAVGICGSDLSGYNDNEFNRPGQVMGHEFVGRIDGLGADVVGLSEGQRVTGYSAQFCGTCFWCLRKERHLCPELFDHYTGYGETGGFAEYTCIRDAVVNRNVFQVPSGLSDEAATLVEPVGVAVRAVDQVDASNATRALVVGGGVIGNLVAQLLVPAVPSVVLTEVSATRRDAAASLGLLKAVLDPGDAGFDECMGRHLGRSRRHFGVTGMADFTIEASGSASGLEQALRYTRPGGRIVCVGLGERPAAVTTAEIVHKELQIVGTMGTNFRRAIDLLAEGSIDTSTVLSHTFELAQITSAFETLNRGEAVKVVIRINSETTRAG